MLSVIKEVRDYELKSELWSGALDTLATIAQEDKLSDLMCLLEELYPEPVDITTINDVLWFDSDFLFEELQIKVDDEIYSCKRRL